MEREHDLAQEAHPDEMRVLGIPADTARVRDVGPRAEGVAGAAQHEHAVPALVGNLDEDVVELLPHEAVGGVLALRAVEGDAHHAFLALYKDGLGTHGATIGSSTVASQLPAAGGPALRGPIAPALRLRTFPRGPPPRGCRLGRV